MFVRGDSIAEVVVVGCGRPGFSFPAAVRLRRRAGRPVSRARVGERESGGD